MFLEYASARISSLSCSSARRYISRGERDKVGAGPGKGKIAGPLAIAHERAWPRALVLGLVLGPAVDGEVQIIIQMLPLSVEGYVLLDGDSDGGL